MASSTQTIFGQRLREARLSKGFAQDVLGVMIGLDESCSSARISRYETGVHEPPFETAKLIASALDVPVAYFYCQHDLIAKVLIALHKMDAEKLNDVFEFIQSSQFD